MKRKSFPQLEQKPKGKKKPQFNHFLIEQFLSQSSLSQIKEEKDNKKDKKKEEGLKENKNITQEVQKERAKREYLLINKGLAIDNKNEHLNQNESLKTYQKSFDNLIFPIIIKTPLGINNDYSILSIKQFINQNNNNTLILLSPKYQNNFVEVQYNHRTIGYITKTISYYLCKIAMNSSVIMGYYLNSNNLEIIIVVKLRTCEIKIRQITMEKGKNDFYQVSYGKYYLGTNAIQNTVCIYKYSLNSQIELIDDGNNKLIKYNKSFEDIYKLICGVCLVREKENNQKTNNTQSRKDIEEVNTSNYNNESDNSDDIQSETKKLFHSFLISNYEHILSMISSYSFLFNEIEISIARTALNLKASEKSLFLKFITRSSKWISPNKLGTNIDEDIDHLLSYSLIQSSKNSLNIENQSELFEYLYNLNNNQLKSIQTQLQHITKLKQSQVNVNFISEIFINNSFYSLDAYLDIPELCNAANQMSQMITEYNFDIEEQKKLKAKNSPMRTFSIHFKKDIVNKSYANSYISKNFNSSNYRKVHLTQQNRTNKNLMILSIINDITSYLHNKSSFYIDNFISNQQSHSFNGFDCGNGKKETIKAILTKYQMLKLDFVFGKIFDCASRLFFFYSQYKDINSIAKEFYGIELFETYNNYLSNVILSTNKSDKDLYTNILKPIFTSEDSFKLFDNLYQIKNAYMISSLTITNLLLNYSLLSSLYIQLLIYLNEDLFNELFPNQSLPSTNKDNEEKVTLLINKLKNANMNRLNDDFLSKYTHGHISAELLTYYAELCERSKKHYKANIIYLFMLLSNHLIKKRGHWWYRTILNFAHHLKTKYNAVQLLNIAHYDKTIKSGYLIKIKEYYLKLIQEKNKAKKVNKILNMLNKGLFNFINDNNNNDHLYDKFFRTIQSESAVSDEKKRLYGIEKQIVSVEEYALYYYNIVHGYDGIHGENEVIPTLYNIFFWNVIYYDRIPYVFQSPYQAFPLDFFYSNFYESRKDIIESRLKEIELLNEKELTETINYIYTNKININSVFIKWNSVVVKKDTLIKIAIAITAPKLAVIFSFLTKNMKYLTKGMPDLFLWKQKDKSKPIVNSALIVEVKSVNDKLSDHQKFWLGLLSKANINVEVLHIK